MSRSSSKKPYKIHEVNVKTRSRKIEGQQRIPRPWKCIRRTIHFTLSPLVFLISHIILLLLASTGGLRESRARNKIISQKGTIRLLSLTRRAVYPSPCARGIFAMDYMRETTTAAGCVISFASEKLLPRRKTRVDCLLILRKYLSADWMVQFLGEVCW